MKNRVKIVFMALSLVSVLTSCKKDNKTSDESSNGTSSTPTSTVTTTQTVEKGTMKIEFINTVDGDPLVFGKQYTNASGETFTVSRFDYYISNIVLTMHDNSRVNIDNFYRIIKHSEDSTHILNIGAIPAGAYKSIKLMIGVDSTRNYSGAQTGGLDIGYAGDMFWGWAQGYIFLKLEGKSAASPTQDITYHIGGYNGPNHTQRELTIDFTGVEASVSKASTPTLKLNVNAGELFKTPTTISFTKFSKILNPGIKDAKMIADNYADMITFGSILN